MSLPPICTLVKEHTHSASVQNCPVWPCAMLINIFSRSPDSNLVHPIKCYCYPVCSDLGLDQDRHQKEIKKKKKISLENVSLKEDTLIRCKVTFFLWRSELYFTYVCELRNYSAKIVNL